MEKWEKFGVAYNLFQQIFDLIMIFCRARTFARGLSGLRAKKILSASNLLILDMILGIDPGLANTGWAILDRRSSIVDDREFNLIECGCLETKIADTSANRLGQIYDELERIIKKYKVKEVAIETLFFAKNAKSAIKVAEAIGVIKICGNRNGLEVFGYTPLQVKMALVGYGRAEKEQVEQMVRNILNLEKGISPSHASDAVAVALTHLFTNRGLKN